MGNYAQNIGTTGKIPVIIGYQAFFRQVNEIFRIITVIRSETCQIIDERRWKRARYCPFVENHLITIKETGQNN